MGLYRFRCFSGITIAGAGLLFVAGMSLMYAGPAQAATSINGPIDLGGATAFGVLGSSAVTNTGPSVVKGDVGVSPGISITGFPPGSFTGTLHQTDAVAAQAQSDLTTAFNAAAGLTPISSGLGDLKGLTLTPGVYSGGALSLSGSLTLDGSATSVWVFQAASTLITASASTITLTGGATSCNVFWKVGSSATLGISSKFVGTIMANQSITATTGATVAGRLLASNAAVTLDGNTITVPTGCAQAGSITVSDSPAITSGTPTPTTVGTPYAFTVTASGKPTPTIAVTAGTLPAGLSFNGTTGSISGTPTTPGGSTFTITASNGSPPSVSAIYTLTVGAAIVGASTGPNLAATGAESLPFLIVGLALLALGLAFFAYSRIPRAIQIAYRHTRSSD